MSASPTQPDQGDPSPPLRLFEQQPGTARTPAEARSLAVRLGEAARDEPERQRLMGEIVAQGDTMAAALGAALAEEDERGRRRTYLEAMVALGGDAVPVAAAMTEDTRWYVVRNALLVLRDTAGTRAVAQFTAGLGHDDPRVRREAVVALAHAGGEDAGLLVLSKIADPHRDVRQAAVRATGTLRLERAVRPLLERLESESDVEVVEEILLALGQIGDPGAVQALERRAEGRLFGAKPPRSVRLAAYRALAAIGTPHARTVVEDATVDRDPAVREVASRLVARG